MSNMSIKKTEKREDRWRRLLALTDENTVAGALDIATKHYLADARNKRELADELTPAQIETLSTPQLPIEVETRVGRNLE